MAKKCYDEASVLRAISKKCFISYSDKSIQVNTSTGQVGNGTWGKIDYLCHYCGWHWIHTVQVVGQKNVDAPNKKRKKSNTEESDNNNNKKIRKMK